jgi:hypothetical protein
MIKLPLHITTKVHDVNWNSSWLNTGQEVCMLSGRLRAENADSPRLIFLCLYDAEMSEDCPMIALNSGRDNFGAIVFRVRHTQVVKPAGIPRRLYTS